MGFSRKPLQESFGGCRAQIHMVIRNR
jgi:hypothetical protein